LDGVYLKKSPAVYVSNDQRWAPQHFEPCTIQWNSWYGFLKLQWCMTC
jgi:hypothetical protein